MAFKKIKFALISTPFKFTVTSSLKIGGLLGDALDSSMNGRLKWFIQDSSSGAIRIYDRNTANNNQSTHWEGECAGKWLYAATRCVVRTNDSIIKEHIRNVADYLISQQFENGYIGTLNENNRYCGNPVKPNQNYDIQMNNYIMQGLIYAYELFHEEKYLLAVKRIAELCINTYQKGNKKIANAAPFEGLGSTIMEPFIELYEITNDKKYLNFAEFNLQEIEQRPGTEIISRTLKNYDAAQIGQGKNYEMLRNYVGIAKMYQVTGNKTYLHVINNAWNEVYNYHKNAAGAPCGGIGIHLECYNVRYMFSPYSYSETCAMMEWFRLNVELLKITGEAKFAGELEEIAYNAMLGAQFPDGYGWIYNSIMNGKRIRTKEYACCSSSGTMILEEVPQTIYSVNDEVLRINIYTPSEASLKIGQNTVNIKQTTDFPFDGKISVSIDPKKETTFSLNIRIPAWIGDSSITIDGKKIIVKPNTYYSITKKWKKSVCIIEFPMSLRLDEKTVEYNHKGEYLDGYTKYKALYRGPLLYSTEWEDTLEKPNSVIIPQTISTNDFKEIPTPAGFHGKTYELQLADTSIQFVPYYEVAHRLDNSFHVCWLQMMK